MSHFETDGWRRHSAARRDIENLKLMLRLDDRSKLTIVANAVQLPFAQDPLGLSGDDLRADPRGAATALKFDTRKSLSQTQGGVIYELRLDADNALRAMVYGGHRGTEQFQSIPPASQASATSPGGVIELGRDYDGADLRFTTQGGAVGRRWSLVGGLACDKLREHRHGYQDFTGPASTPVLGVKGALRRDEINDVQDLDPYLQATWHAGAAWTLDAGVRHSSVRFVSHDHYIVGANPDDSGRASQAAMLPVLGVLYAWRPDVHLYATAGRGFETPTLNEIAYRPDGASGLNFALKPSRSNNVELGVKTRSAAWGALDVAVFGTRTHDEIVSLSNTGGRSTYQNVASTRRLRLEVEWARSLVPDLEARVAWTLLDARFANAFLACTGTPCAAPATPVAAGNRIPGIARNAMFATLAWTPPRGWRAGIEGRALGRVAADDTNADTAAAFATANLWAGYQWPLGAWRWSTFARLDNVTGRRYVGSVIVDEGNGRYFEPASGRTFFAGLTGSYRY